MTEPTAPVQPQRDLAIERAALEGTLAALADLRENLTLRRDEVRDATAREVYDEVLTLLDSLDMEYRRRHDALPAVSARHASYVFLLDDAGTVHPLPHALYVALARGEAVAPDFAGRTLRLAEWYVRLKDGEPETVANETWGLVAFDAEGRVDWRASPAFHPRRPGEASAPMTAALPTAQERTRMLDLIFPARA
ncbi:hypothetical protein EDC61_10895 [Sulfuritortus calidifontis]|uniref:Uncharacterized protein n=1 Tax=Sulfuritortus calidifontis TaxID=1914471 RepID=A0A4R3JWZ0_9PROT|nr:hypothetical protein [Sulfuritortus calidifontis]TCS71752.1 hypothetical protein EDC61_10895 [Sulfuritortus calidifontis]